ncbi:TetR/AcrR family transcriptional regulator [Actinomadura chokoriensis]
MSEAVWRVLAEHGFGGLTLRAVAAEMGASTGLLTHYFPNKKALVAHALDVAEERTRNRPLRAATAAPGMAALRAALLDVLSLTPAGTDMNRVWVSSWDVSLADPALASRQKDRYDDWRRRLRPHVAAAVSLGELPASTDADDVVASAAAFAHGLVVHALFDPDRFPPGRQIALLDAFLTSLTPAR